MWVTLTLPLTGSLIPRVNPDCKRNFKKTVRLLVWDGRRPSWAQYDPPTAAPAGPRCRSPSAHMSCKLPIGNQLRTEPRCRRVPSGITMAYRPSRRSTGVLLRRLPAETPPRFSAFGRANVLSRKYGILSRAEPRPSGRAERPRDMNVAARIRCGFNETRH